MTDTIREQIISAFTLRAAPLTSNDVTRVTRYHEESAQPNVSIWDGEEVQADLTQYGIQAMVFPIAVHMQWPVVDITNSSTATSAKIGEIVAAILLTDSTFAGLADKTEYASATPEYPEDGGDIISLTVIFNVYFSTVKGDPTAQINP